MPFLNVRGLVIASVPRKESDRMIRILTRDHGLLTAMAPGAAKTNSRFAYASMPLVLCDFVLSTSHDFYYLKEAEAVFTFQGIQTDIIRLTAASHLLEISEDASIDKDMTSTIYPLLLYALYALNQSDHDWRLTLSVFEWKVSDISGFSANLTSCACGEEDTGKIVAFSFDQCGICCQKSACLRSAGKYQLISSGTLSALRYIVVSPPEKLFSFTVTEPVLLEMSTLTRQYISERYEKKYTKPDLILGLLP